MPSNLSIGQAVSKVNSTFNNLPECDASFPLGISDVALRHGAEIVNLAYYLAEQAKLDGLIPHKFVYLGFDPIGEDGGTHRFNWKCESRRVQNLRTLLDRMSFRHDVMDISDEEYMVFRTSADNFTHTEGTNVSTWRGIQLRTPTTID